ncbi:uncharacterized protein PF11_0213 [Nilaparvata lugens]|uniref:uncharacterized protein PF11_0213 n=1 Tax=Nilaparvata lugens TaxID=108931 RepID=UPI00193CDBF6|nr:uncharacterized protein PF11_0213 [Nilaparvata lugens]
MYRRNIYFYFVNFQMKQTICRRCFQFQNLNSSPKKSLLVGDKNLSLKSQQMHLMSTEHSESREVLNHKIKEWRNAKPDISLAKIVQLQFIRREELLMRKILSYILRDSPRCYRRLSLREKYVRPRKASRKIRFLHDLPGVIVAFYNSKHFRLIAWSHIHEISKRVLMGQRNFRQALRSKINIFTSKYRKGIPTMKSYLARHLNFLQNRQNLKRIGTSQYQKDDSINKSVPVLKQEKVDTYTGNILNFSVSPAKYIFERPDRKRLESLMAFYFTKFQEGVPALSDYFSKYSQESCNGATTKNKNLNISAGKNEHKVPISRHHDDVLAKNNNFLKFSRKNKERENETEVKLSFNRDILKNRNGPFISDKNFDEIQREEDILGETYRNRMKLQSSIQERSMRKSLHDTNDLQSIMKNDVDIIGKLRCVEEELVKLSRGSSETGDGFKDYEVKNKGDEKKTLFEIDMYDSISREVGYNTQTDKEMFWKESEEVLKDDKNHVPKNSEDSELGNFPDDIINSYRKLKGNYLSIDLIDNALMLSTPVDSEIVENLKNSNVLKESEANVAKFIDAGKNVHEEFKSKLIHSEDMMINTDSSNILNQIEIMNIQNTEKKLESFKSNSGLEEISENRNVIEAGSTFSENSRINNRPVSKTYRNNEGENETNTSEVDNETNHSSYIMVNENKLFSKNVFRKNESSPKVDSGLKRKIKGVEMNFSESHRIGDYPEFRSALRGSNKRFSISRILGCDQPAKINHGKQSHSNALKKNLSTSPKKKTNSQLEKKTKSIKYMQSLLLSKHESSNHHTHTQSNNVIQEKGTDINNNEETSLMKVSNFSEFKDAAVTSLKGIDDVFLIPLSTEKLKVEHLNKNKENNIEASKDLKGGKTLLENTDEIDKKQFLEFFSSFQEKLDFLQNEYKPVDFNCSKLNSVKNEDIFPSRSLDEFPIKTLENDSDSKLPLNEKYFMPNGSTELVSLDGNLENISKNYPKTEKFLENEFISKCRFDFRPELEKDNLIKKKTLAGNTTKPTNNHQDTQSLQKGFDRNEGFEVLPPQIWHSIQNKENQILNIENRNPNQNTKYFENEFQNNFEFQPHLELHSQNNEFIQVEHNNIKQSEKYFNNFDENNIFDIPPDFKTNNLRDERTPTHNIGPKNISQSKKYFKNEFDYKCRFDSVLDPEINTLKKETTATEKAQDIKITRKFSDLVTKLEQLKINNTNWLTQPIVELTNKNGSLDEIYPKTINLHKQLPSRDSLQNKTDKNKFNINDEPRNKKEVENANVSSISQGIILPSNMRPYFDHDFSRIMDNFKLPDLTKYSAISGLENTRKTKGNLINNKTELQGEGVVGDYNFNDKKQNKARIELAFDKIPIRDETRLQIIEENNEKINLNDISCNNSLKKDIVESHEKTKGFERHSKKMKIDVFADVLNNKITESVALLRHIPKTSNNFGWEGQEVDNQQTSWTINNTIPRIKLSTNQVQTIPKITNNLSTVEQKMITHSESVISQGEDELTGEITFINKAIQTKPHELAIIQNFNQDYLVHEEINPSKISGKSSREIANLGETFDEVQVQNQSKSLIADANKSNMKSTWFSTAANNLEFNGTRICCNRFEDSLRGGGDCVYGDVYKKGEMVGRNNASGVTPEDDEQSKMYQRDNHLMETLPKINTMIFKNRNSSEHNEDTLADDCRDIVGENSRLSKKEKSNINDLYRKVSNNVNIHSKYGRGSGDYITTRKIRKNELSKSKQEKRVSNLNEDVNAYYGSPLLKSTVSNEGFGKIVNDHADNYDYIYSEIFVNSKIDKENNLLEAPKGIHRNSRKQGQGIVREENYSYKTNSRESDRDVEQTRGKSKIIDHEVHRTVELAKLDRLHKVLNDLEGLIGSLMKNVENKHHDTEDGRTNIDYGEQRMMLRDINDSIISSLASLHIFKGNYNKLKLDRQFKRLNRLDNSEKYGEMHLYIEEDENKRIPLQKCGSNAMKEHEIKDYGTGIFAFGQGAMEQIYSKDSNISPTGNNFNFCSKLDECEPTRSNRIVDRFYKYKHPSFITQLSKIPEEETVATDKQQIGECNRFTNHSMENSMNVRHSSTIFAGSLKKQLNPEHVRKVLKQLCTRSVVDEMLHKTQVDGSCDRDEFKNDIKNENDRYYA